MTKLPTGGAVRGLGGGVHVPHVYMLKEALENLVMNHLDCMIYVLVIYLPHATIDLNDPNLPKTALL
jgi:hypothetical protein